MLRKIISLIFIFLFIMSTVNLQGVNAEGLYDSEVSNKHELYQTIKSGIEKLKSDLSIKLNNYDESKYDINKVIDKVINDNPELQFQIASYSGGFRNYYSFQTYRVLDLKFRYNESKKNLNKLIEVKNYKEFEDALIETLDKFNDRLLLKIYNYNDYIYSIQNAIDRAFSKNPDLDYGYSGFIYSIYGQGTDRIIDIDIKYDLTKNEMIHMRNSVDEKAKKIVKEIINSDMTDFEKELALHDYVVNNSSYAIESLENNSVPIDERTAYGVLVKGKGICSSYTKAMQKLLNLVGIENYYIKGYANGEAHAWNIVKIQGEFYHLDATFDDPITVNGEKILSYDYFNLSDKDIWEDHSWDIYNYPECNYSTFSYENIKKMLDENIEIDLDKSTKNIKTIKDLPHNTVVIGNRGFNLEFINNFDNWSLISDYLYNIESTYIKTSDRWVDMSGLDVDTQYIPSIEYTSDGINYVHYNSMNRDSKYNDEIIALVEEELFGSSVRVDILINGNIDYKDASKYSISTIKDIVDLGQSIILFPDKAAGDIVQLQLYNEDEELITTKSIMLTNIIKDIYSPIDISVTPISESEIELYWEDIKEAEYYYVYRSNSYYGPYLPYLDENGDKQEHTNSALIYGIEPDTTLYFKITSVKDGIESDFSEIVFATTFEKNKTPLDIVKGGYFNNHQNMSIEDGFNEFFDSSKWEYFETAEGDHIVQFIGEYMYLNRPAIVLMQFTVDVLNESFYVNYSDRNEIIMSDYTLEQFLQEIFSN